MNGRKEKQAWDAYLIDRDASALLAFIRAAPRFPNLAFIPIRTCIASRTSTCVATGIEWGDVRGVTNDCSSHLRMCRASLRGCHMAVKGRGCGAG
jgi:hypothetical protein